jgi:predicted small lipoprotein YifL
MVIVIFSLTACGKKGPLIYPDMLTPAAASDVSASQSGSSIKLQFVLPETDRSGSKLAALAGVKIKKREGDFNKESDCSSCMTDYHLFRTLYLDVLPEGTQRYGNRILLLDGDATIGKTYSYFVVPFTKDGADGLASNQVSVKIVQPTFPPVIRAESFPTEIKISFVTLPPILGQFLGYNIYRAAQEDLMPSLPINREPIIKNDYIDSGLERNITYRYTVRTILKLDTGSLLESPVSNLVDGMLKNDE